jgi:RNA polymerase sigma-70 factor (ECF subfamily)
MAMTMSPLTEELVVQHREALLTYARRMTGDAHAAEDIVQAALLKALQALRGGTPVTNVRAWLYRVTHNEASTWRRRTRLQEGVLRDRPAVTSEPDRTSLLPQVHREIQALEEPYQSAIRLRYLQHLTNDEVAGVLDLPVGTVKSHVARGLRRLSDRLADALEGDVKS